MDRKHFYVIYVPGGKANEAAELLKRTVLTEGEHAFVPKIERERRRGGSTRVEKTELFPGYVFIETSNPEAFSERLFMTGRGRAKPLWLLRNDYEALPLREEEEEWIRSLLNEEYLVEMSYGLKEGDRVHITRGPLKDLAGRIVRVNRHHRSATIRVEFLGDYREITLGLELIGNTS